MPIQLDPIVATTAPTQITTNNDTTREAIEQRAKLFADFIDPSHTLIDIANQHHIPLTEVVAWAERPEVIAFLDRFAEVSERRARLFASMAAPDAVNAISHALHASNPETSRRAAGTILRHTKPLPSIRTPSASSGTESTSTQPPFASAPTPSDPQSIRALSASSGPSSKSATTQHPQQPSEVAPLPRDTAPPSDGRDATVIPNRTSDPTINDAPPCHSLDPSEDHARVPVPGTVSAHVPTSVGVETPTHPSRPTSTQRSAPPPRRAKDLAAAA